MRSAIVLLILVEHAFFQWIAQLYAALINLKTAFDTFTRERLWKKLEATVLC